MTRKAQPYAAISVSEPGGIRPLPPVGTAPTLNTRRHFATNAFVGLITFGKASAKVPIQQPYSGQGAIFPAFPHFTGSSVAPNIRGTNLLVAINSFSPISHAEARRLNSLIVPPPAVSPTVLRRPPQTQSGRPSGRYTIEYPPPAQWWPTSAQWLAEKVRLGQQPPSGWQGHGGRP